MKISTNQFKNGTKLLIDNAPCSIIEHEFHKPGKGQAVMRVKYKTFLPGTLMIKPINLVSLQKQQISITKIWSSYIVMVNFGTLWIPQILNK